MRKFYLILSLLGALFMLSSLNPLSAQNKEFWFVVPDANEGHADKPIYFMFTAGSLPTTVTISMPKFGGTGKFVTKVIPLQAYQSYELSYSSQADVNILENSQDNSNKITQKGVLITATNPISAYYALNGGGQKEIFTLKGENALGSEFYTPFQTKYTINPPNPTHTYNNSYRQIHIVATEDNTIIDYTPTANVYNSEGAVLTAGTTYTKTLQRGETLGLRESVKNTGTMLMGTHIKARSGKKIAVTVYEDSVESRGQDPIGDQIVPIDALGKNYLVVKGFSRERDGKYTYDHVYILATKDGTTVTEYTEKTTGVMTPVTKTIAKAGQYAVFDIGDVTQNPQYRVYETSEPVYCYHQSATGGELGGALIPSMYSIASKDISFNNLNLYNASDIYTNNSIFLIYRKSSKDSFYIKNGATGTKQKLNLTSQNAVPGRLNGEWMYSKQLLTGFSGVTTITNDNGAFALGYFAATGGTSLYGYLSNFGNFSFPEPIIASCGPQEFDVGYAKEITWTVPNPGDYTAAELKDSRLTAKKSGNYKVKIDLDMGTPRTHEVYLKVQNFGAKYDFPKTAFVGDKRNFKIQLNPTGDVDNAYNAKYTWEIEGAAAGGGLLKVEYPKSTDPNYETGVSNTLPAELADLEWATEGNKKITLRIANVTAKGCDTIIVKNILVNNYPGNVTDETCTIDPAAKLFTIATPIDFPANLENGNVHSMATPLVAYLDGNDTPEIISPKVRVYNDPWASDGFVIVNSKKNTMRTITTKVFATHGQPVAIADVNNDKKPKIFLQCCDDGRVYCYNPDGTLYAGFTTTDNLGDHYIIQIADLNNDGNPELIAGPYIFNAKTGKLLLKMTFQADGTGYGSPHARPKNQGYNYNGYYFMPAIGDIDGDGDLEIVAGSTVYDVNIVAGSNSAEAGNTYTTKKVISTGQSAAFKSYLDGPTILVDFDLDGELDVCVVGHEKTTTAVAGVGSYFQFYVWNPRTQKVIAYAPMSNREYWVTIPYAGDLDNNGYPDIAFATYPTLGLVTYQYDKTKPADNYISSGPNTALSSAFAETAGFTMFDFNQDGRAEIVYRGINGFYIINLKDDKTDYQLASPIQSVWSGTVAEYPIVADVDGDGQAEIILTRAFKTWGSGDLRGGVSIYKSEAGKEPWAPARPVWNQWNYNAVNINDNLTVPKYQLSPAATFPGEDGILGTADDKRPYNGMLLQQTMLGKSGKPVFLTPNAQLKDKGNIEYIYDANTDIMTIKNVTIENKKLNPKRGAAPINAPIHVTVYKMNGGVKQVLTTYKHMTSIGVNAEATFDIPINQFNAKLAIDKILISINDDGEGKNPYQPVCETCDPNESGAFQGIELAGIAWIDGSYRKCVGDKAEFKSQTSLSGSEFTKQWFRPGSGTVWKTGATTEISSLAVGDVGQYTFKATNTTSKLSVTHVLPHLSAATGVMSWRSDAADKNWNNVNNWNTGTNSTAGGTQLKSVPSGCTTVHIPAVATNYPQLQENAGAVTTATDWSLYGQPTAENIIYHYGAETAYPHKLNYKKAYVQYNFGYYNPMLTAGTNVDTNSNGETAVGASKLKRNQWYLMSSPLKKTASGDFSFGGYPFTWQAVNQKITEAAGNLPSVNLLTGFTQNDVDLSTQHNVIGLKVAAYSKDVKGHNEQKHLQALNGILELPYIDNAAQQEWHPMHSYDPISKASSFYYYDAKTLQQLASPVGNMKRSEADASKFVFEGNTAGVAVGLGSPQGQENALSYKLKVKTSGASRKVLIGNPFMSTIDMQRFKNANFQTIAGAYYEVYENGLSKQYNYDANNGINSLQAFVVTLSGTAQEVELYFPLEGNYALTGTTTGKIPRRLQIPGALAVAAINQTGLGGDYAELGSVQAHTQTGNVGKLISQEGHAIPEVFFVDETGNNYNLIQNYKQGISEVGLGVKCSDTQNELSLTFNHIAEFSQINNATPILVDKLLGVEQDLSENNTYRFRQHTTANSQSQYADKKRFAIRFGQDTSTRSSDDNLQVIYTNGYLQVKTTIAAIQIEVYNLGGQLLFNSGAVNTTHYQQNLPLVSGGYIVKVKTADNKTASKKIMAQ